MPISFTKRGRYRLTRDGVEISQHNAPEEAYENAFEDAENDGNATYRIYPPEYVEFRVPVVTIAARGTRPPTAPGFTAPNAPTGVSAAQGSPASSTIRVTFTPGTDTNTPAATITSNKLYGSNTSGGTFTLVATLGAAATTGDETGIATSTTRYYKVSTVNEHGLESVLSSEVNATTAAGSPVAGEPAVYALEVIYPMATAASPNGRDADDACNFAYTGLTRTIHACAIGGSYPYTWSLTNAPAWLAINASTGAMTLTNPTSSASDIVVTCTDSLGSTANQTWSITVGTSGWNFVDAVSGNDTTGTGAIGAPWQTLAKVSSTAAANSRTYFRAGTYTMAGLTTANTDDINGEEYVGWNIVADSLIWLAYPGDAQPVIDFGYVGTGYPYNTGDSVPRFRMQGDCIYMDGLKFYRSMTMALQFIRTNQRGVNIVNCDFDDHGPGLGGGNSACMMWVSSGGQPSFGDIVKNCTFNDIQYGTGNCALKLYGNNKMLIEGNVATNTGADDEATFAIKGDVLTRITVRGNSGDFDVTGIGGNMASTPGMTAEICYNCIRSDDTAFTLGVAKVTNLGQVDVYRNTFVGHIIIHNLVTADGPYNFRRNVIINSAGAQTPWPYFSEFAVSDQTRLVLDNNLTGAAADAIVDASGNLQGAYLTNYGPTTENPRGYQLP